MNSNFEVLPIAQVNEVESYPYGRLRTKAFFSVEFVKGKGFRSVFQTIDPKNGRLNAPKKSTYSHLTYCVKNLENGHIEFKGLRFYGWEDIPKACAFLAEHQPALQLTAEMISELCALAFTCIRGNAVYSGLTKEEITPVIDEPVKILLEGFKTGVIDWSKVNLNAERIKELKEAKAA